MFAPSTRRAAPARVIGFDTEDRAGEIIQACFYGDDGALERCFHVDDVGTPAEVRRQTMKFMMQELKGRVRIAAINLEYDVMNAAWPEFFTPDVFEVTLVRGRWILAKLKGTGVVMFELGNHIPQSAKSWGAMLGCPKLDFAPNDPVYCMRDAEIAYRAASFLRDLYAAEGGELKLTAPSAALEIYRRRFLERSFAPVDSDRLAFYRGAYYGGRCEVFRHGKVLDRIESVDVKSMYPSLMLEPIPNYATAYEANEIPDDPWYVADVEVEVPECHIPVLSLRRDGKLLFPVGRFRATYCGPELERARRSGVVVLETFRVVRFADARPYLAEYVREFYPKKEAAEREGRSAMRAFYKTGLLNSLYGKFGSTGTIERFAWIDGERTLYDFVDEEPEPAAYANVIWAAWVTALGRVKLYDALEAVDDLVYCDTDSVIFAGGSRLKYGCGLGEWESKGRYLRGEFWRPKVYAMTGVDDTGNVIHVRGVPLSFQDKIVEDAYVEFSAPLRMREAMRRGERPNVWVSHSKTLDREYDKRAVLRGGRTEPLRVVL